MASSHVTLLHGRTAKPLGCKEWERNRGDIAGGAHFTCVSNPQHITTVCASQVKQILKK